MKNDLIFTLKDIEKMKQQARVAGILEGILCIWSLLSVILFVIVIINFR